MTTLLDLHGYNSQLGTGTAHELTCSGCPTCSRIDRLHAGHGTHRCGAPTRCDTCSKAAR